MSSKAILLFIGLLGTRAIPIEKNEIEGYEAIELEDVLFLLYTRESKENYCQLKIGDGNGLRACGFNNSNPTKIATHGWNDDALVQNSVQYLKSAFLELGEFNFIAVDWSACSRNINYFHAVKCTKDVGHYLGDFLIFLMKETDLKAGDAHIMGHSLGAHVAGFVSDKFPDEKIGRISGFDPAGPLFESAEASERLDPNDAVVVDVIHTDTIFLGITRPVGTLDFYPNGGNHQPGCNGITKTCNHGASHRYFFDTIPESNRQKYEAAKCDSVEEAKKGNCDGVTGYLGYDSYLSEPGIYYLKMTEIP